MSRVVSSIVAPERPHIVLATLIVALLALPGVPAVAQDVPPCEGEIVSDCVLPPWPESALLDAPSPFGAVSGEVWVEDAVGDAPANGLDILAVGLGTVTIDEPRVVRRADGLLKRGRAANAVRRGENLVVRVVLDRPPDAIEEGHAGVHVVTDIDGSRSNNAPAGVSEPNGPWAGWQDVYSVTYATTTGSTQLFKTDLTGQWYKDRSAFAAAWAAPGVLDVLVRPAGLGDGFAVVAHVGGSETGGYDTAALRSKAIPVDGRVGPLPLCSESSLATDPFVVRRLIENGQTLRNIQVPASWRAGAAIPVDAEAGSDLASFLAAQDADGDGRIHLPSTVSIVEDGRIVRQRPDVAVSLEGDAIHLALELGLTRRGYAVLRDVVLQPTSDPIADAALERAVRAFVTATPPIRVGRNPGLLEGPAIGGCTPSLIEPRSTDPEPGDPDSVTTDVPPVDDGAAADT